MSENSPARSKPSCSRDDAKAVVRRLRDAGHAAYFAGGCVRDLLLGMTPKDYDVATDAPPQRVRDLFSNTQAVGAVFGVILVRHRKSTIEVATFRSDGAYQDGRRPTSVTFTNAQEDAKRRDFTINGLFMDPLEEDRIIDYVGGVEDLRAKRLRAIGNPLERFAEDHLRLLRAIRFAARFDLAIEDKTAAAIKRDASKLISITPERVGEELRMMLTPLTRTTAWEMLNRFELAAVIFRFWKADHTHRFARASVFARIAPAQAIPFGLALAGASLDHAGIFPLDRPSVTRLSHALRQSLKISNEEKDDLEGTLEGIGMLLEQDEEQDDISVARLKRFLARPTAPFSREIIRGLAQIDVQRRNCDRLEGRLLELERTEFEPAPWVTGNDLTAAGLRPGPLFKRVLDAVYDAQLEHRVEDRESAMKFALELAKRP